MNSKKFQLDGLGVPMRHLKRYELNFPGSKPRAININKKKLFINYYTRDKIKFLSGVSNFEIKKFFFGLM